MKYLKLFESYSEIESICNKYNIRNWKVNSDGLVDVEGDVIFPSHKSNISKALNGLEKLPLKFGNVSGNFDCHNQKLTTLEGSPSYVGGNFNCNDNKIPSLEGGPKEVGGTFWARYNKLTSLKGSPIRVGAFDCSHNEKLLSLEGAPIDIGNGHNPSHVGCYQTPIYQVYNLFLTHKDFMDSLDYNYLRGTDIIKWRFKEALEEVGMKLPKSIPGWNYI